MKLFEQIKRACIIATTTVNVKGTQKSFPLKNDLPEELFSWCVKHNIMYKISMN